MNDGSSVEDPGTLAERAMDDKRRDGNPEIRSRELYDVPSEEASSLASGQDDEPDEAE